jgi:hypothetical protein
MIKYVFVSAFVAFASLVVYGATITPAAVAFDGYDNSSETMLAGERGDIVEPGIDRYGPTSCDQQIRGLTRWRNYRPERIAISEGEDV